MRTAAAPEMTAWDIAVTTTDTNAGWQLECSEPGSQPSDKGGKNAGLGASHAFALGNGWAARGRKKRGLRARRGMGGHVEGCRGDLVACVPGPKWRLGLFGSPCSKSTGCVRAAG